MGFGQNSLSGKQFSKEVKLCLDGVPKIGHTAWARPWLWSIIGIVSDKCSGPIDKLVCIFETGRSWIKNRLRYINKKKYKRIHSFTKRRLETKFKCQEHLEFIPNSFTYLSILFPLCSTYLFRLLDSLCNWCANHILGTSRRNWVIKH